MCPVCGVFVIGVKGSAVARPRELPYSESGLESRRHTRPWWCREPGRPRGPTDRRPAHYSHRTRPRPSPHRPRAVAPGHHREGPCRRSSGAGHGASWCWTAHGRPGPATRGRSSNRCTTGSPSSSPGSCYRTGGRLPTPHAAARSWHRWVRSRPPRASSPAWSDPPEESNGPRPPRSWVSVRSRPATPSRTCPCPATPPTPVTSNGSSWNGSSPCRRPAAAGSGRTPPVPHPAPIGPHIRLPDSAGSSLVQNWVHSAANSGRLR